MVVVPVALPLLAAISVLRISVPGDLRPMDARRAVLLSLQEVRGCVAPAWVCAARRPCVRCACPVCMQCG